MSIRFVSIRTAFAIGVGFASIACGGSDEPAAGAGQLTACDPLAAQEEPIELGTVIAAGRDSSGTAYVAAQPPDRDAEPRVFVSSGDVLFRRRVLGSGFRVGPEDVDYTWSFETDGGPQRLVAQLREDEVVTGMAIVSDDGGRTFLDELGIEAEPLTLLAPGEVQVTPLRNLPGETVLEYAARVESGLQLVVTRPRDDWSYEDFRVFSGSGGRLDEREVLSVQRAKDGGTTRIVFRFDGADYEALFPAPLSPLSEATLSGEGQVWRMIREDASEGLPTDTSYRCAARDRTVPL